LLLTLAASALVAARAGLAQEPADDPHATGCRPPTPEEEAWMRQNLIVTRQVRLNALGLQRVNAARAGRGLVALSATDVGAVALGDEVVGETAEDAAQGRFAATPVRAPGGVGVDSFVPELGPLDLPAALDNSTLNAFPPIASQGGLGSCASFSATYYTLTHMTALARGINAKTGGNSTRFSTKFVYNMINGGSDDGSWTTGAYAIHLKHGCPTLAEWTYDSSHLQWPTALSIWRNALPYRARQTGTIYSVDTETGMNQLKTLLLDGYVLNFATYVNSWSQVPLNNDPDTAEDDAFANQSTCHQVAGTAGAHAMTIVGYNDHIWKDINGNGFVDPGEKGALKIANSWGSGDWNGGYRWLCYDALNAKTKVAGWTPSGSRGAAFWGSTVYWLTAHTNYTPTHFAEFTVRHGRRNTMQLYLGTSNPTTNVPTTSWTPAAFQWSGGAYAFDGTTNAVDGQFTLDFTDIAATNRALRWYLRMWDSSTGDTGTIKALTLVQSAPSNRVACTGTTPGGGLPLSGDNTNLYAWVDHGSGTVVDTTAPATITNLQRTGTGAGGLQVRWTAPGDDGTNGDAVAGYDLRYRDAPIGTDTWELALAAAAPAPQPPGQTQYATLTGLAPTTTYYVAVKAWDHDGNTNELSNVASGTTTDRLRILTPPVLPDAWTNSPYAVQLEAAGGTTGYNWYVRYGEGGVGELSAAGNGSGSSGLPPNLAIDYETDRILGIPVTAGVFHVTIAVNDSGSPSQSTNQEFELTVRAPVAAAGRLQLSTNLFLAGEGSGAATVTVTRASGASGEVSVCYAALNWLGRDRYGRDSFDPVPAATGTLSWTDGAATAQAFTVPILDDSVVTSRYVTLALFNPQGGAAIGTPATGRVVVVENDSGLLFSPSNRFTVVEGATNNLQVRLSLAPTGDVQVSFALLDGSDPDFAFPAGTALVFTASNWSNWQPLAVTALDDPDEAAGTGVLRAASASVESADLPLVEFDNDVRVLVTASNGLTVAEASNRVFGVKLSSAPAASVTVSVARMSGDADITVSSGSTRVFSTNDWHTWQLVTVAVAADVDITNDTAALRCSAPGLPATTVTVAETDRDVLAIQTDTSAVWLVEGTTVNVRVRLSNLPTNDVTVSAGLWSGDADVQVTDGSVLLFTTADWNLWKTSVVAAAHDADRSNGVAVLRWSAADALPRDVTVTESDDENAPCSITIVAPTNNALYPSGTDLPVLMTATDDTGVASVELFADATNRLAVFTNEPYAWTWTNARVGLHVLAARAVDLDGLAVWSAGVTVTGAPPAAGGGTGLLREWWTNLSGTALSSLTNSPLYPGNPSGSAAIGAPTGMFEGPVNWADNYGARYRGLFRAPLNGPYRFGIASDDSSALLLASGESPSGAVRVAWVAASTASREWTKETNQWSGPIVLEAGRRYYVEALHKESTGNDNLAVAVDYPGGHTERPAAYHRFDLPYLWTVTASAGPNGAVTPAGAVPVYHGGCTNFLIAAAPYFRVADVRVDGFSAGPTGEWTFASVTTNRTLEALFAECQATNHGTPHWWLAQCAGATNLEVDESLDFDGDGMLNWQEYSAGTDPTNRDSCLRLELLCLPGSNGLVWVTLTNWAGTPFGIARSTNLQAGAWTTLDPGVPRTPPTNRWWDPAPVPGMPNYYRLILTNSP
jgi:hypothetical protein